MLAEPKFTPLSCGCVTGVVCPAAMLIVVGDTVTLVVSLLLRVTITPLGDAGLDRATAYGID